MSTPSHRNRVLNPLERFSEVVFGLIMVLTFTCAVGVAQSGRDDLRTMMIGAIGCNLAWGIIDAAFYLIACITERGRKTLLLRAVQAAPAAPEVHAKIADFLPPMIAEALTESDLTRLHAHLKQAPAPDKPPVLTKEDWLGAAAVFLLVFASTFPVVIPFIFVHDARLALHLSNAVAIVLLFGAGHTLARYAGLRPLRTGLLMVTVGAVLVAVAIALGG